MQQKYEKQIENLKEEFAVQSQKSNAKELKLKAKISQLENDEVKMTRQTEEYFNKFKERISQLESEIAQKNPGKQVSLLEQSLN